MRYGYPVRFEPNGEGGLCGTFRDVPEALTEVWPDEDKKAVALDALITAIDFYIEDQRKFPKPSKPQKGEEIVELPVSVVSKVLLLNLMRMEFLLVFNKLHTQTNIRPFLFQTRLNNIP